MLKRDIQIGQNFTLGHQRNDLVHVGVRVDVVQADPDAKLPQGLTQFLHAAFERPAIPEAGTVFDINSIGTGILGDHQQLTYTRPGQAFGFFHHVADRAADQIAAHIRDDAKAATVIAALRDFQVGVVAGGELHTLGWNQVDVRVVYRRVGHKLMDGADDLFVGGGTGNTEHLGMLLHNGLCVSTFSHTAGDNHFAILTDGLTDRIQGFLLCAIDKSAGIYHNHLGIFIAGYDIVSVHFQLGEYALGVNQGFGTAQTDEANFVVGHGKSSVGYFKGRQF